MQLQSPKITYYNYTSNFIIFLLFKTYSKNYYYLLYTYFFNIRVIVMMINKEK